MTAEQGSFVIPDANSRRDIVREPYWRSAQQVASANEKIADETEKYLSRGVVAIDALQQKLSEIRRGAGATLLEEWSHRGRNLTALMEEAASLHQPTDNISQAKDSLVAEIILACRTIDGDTQSFFPGLTFSVRKYLPDEGYHKYSMNHISVHVTDPTGEDQVVLQTKLYRLSPHIATATGRPSNSLVVGRELIKPLHPERVQESQDNFLVRRGLEIRQVDTTLAEGGIDKGEKEKLHEIKAFLAAQVLREWVQGKKEGKKAYGCNVTVTHLKAPWERWDLDLLEFHVDINGEIIAKFKSPPPWLQKGSYYKRSLTEELDGIEFDAVKPRKMPPEYYAKSGVYSYASAEDALATR